MHWSRRVLGIFFAIFAFYLGLFLVVFPWLRAWGMNWVPVHSSLLGRVWMSPYFRGAVSGLGLLNIYVALGESARQIRLLFQRAIEREQL
jgi:hypothetical protein